MAASQGGRKNPQRKLLLSANLIPRNGFEWPSSFVTVVPSAYFGNRCRLGALSCEEERRKKKRRGPDFRICAVCSVCWRSVVL